jgi:hypothetical protein
MTKTFTLEFLSEQTLVTEGLEYSSDEDGNIMILQDGMYITLTPQQQIALKSLLEAHIDTLQFAWSKR